MPKHMKFLSVTMFLIISCMSGVMLNDCVYSRDNDLKILTFHDMSKIICELDDYRYCFDLKRDRITRTDFYKNDRQLFKERFFDRLSVEDKNIIYKLLNNI